MNEVGPSCVKVGTFLQFSLMLIIAFPTASQASLFWLYPASCPAIVFFIFIYYYLHLTF